jgi:DNA repair protein RadC
LETAQRLLIAVGGLRGLLALSTAELQSLEGISAGRAAQLKAAIELGARIARGDQLQRRQVRSPTDIVDLLLLEMSHLDQEHLRTVLLDTKNRIQEISTLIIWTRFDIQERQMAPF